MVTVEDATLGGLGAVASILYVVVAAMQAKRPVSAAARPALYGFVFWWSGLALLGIYGLVTRFVADPLEYGLTGYRAILYPLVVIVLGMCAGLVYYLLFLYTGNRKVLWVSVGFFAVWFALWLFSIEAFTPMVGDDPSTSQPGPEFYTAETPPVLLSAVVGLGLILPLLGSAIAYALLYFRSDDATAKYRIAMVSGGFVLWFLYSALGSVTRIATGDAEQGFMQQLLGQLFGLVAATLTLLAYKPPAFVRAKGIRSLRDD